MGCFYHLPIEIFPTNISNNPVSTLNSKLIKGKVLKFNLTGESSRTFMNFRTTISVSQGLELFKYLNICPRSDEFLIFNPYI